MLQEIAGRAYLDLVAQKLRKNVISNARGAKCVEKNPLLGQVELEFEVQNADVGHCSSHGMPNRKNFCARMLCQKLSNGLCDVWL